MVQPTSPERRHEPVAASPPVPHEPINAVDDPLAHLDAGPDAPLGVPEPRPSRRRARAPDSRAQEPERRCIVTRQSQSRGGLIRFVLDPQRRLVPDLAEKLGGRGVYVSADRAALEEATRRKAFHRAARGPVETPANLPDTLSALLQERLIQTLGLCKRAGIITFGFEKVRARLAEDGPPPILVLVADDAGRDGAAKIAKVCQPRRIPVLAALPAQALGRALGRDLVVHISLERNPLTDSVIRDAARLRGVRGDPPPDGNGPPDGEPPDAASGDG